MVTCTEQNIMEVTQAYFGSVLEVKWADVVSSLGDASPVDGLVGSFSTSADQSNTDNTTTKLFTLIARVRRDHVEIFVTKNGAVCASRVVNCDANTDIADVLAALSLCCADFVNMAS